MQGDMEEREEIGNEQMIEEEIGEEETSNEQSFRMDQPGSEEESYSDQDSDESEQTCNFGDSLRNWALTFGVSLVALTALLSLLRLYHPDLPKDARTLLKTTTTYSIERKCEGLYYYIGILSSFKQKLQQAFESFADGCTLKLQINIDGLPLFKSSGIQQPTSSRAILLCPTSTTTPPRANLLFSTSTTHPSRAILIFSTSTMLSFKARLIFYTSYSAAIPTSLLLFFSEHRYVSMPSTYWDVI
ncbi:unnamed protein product [Leuciscus chuanchicus]